MKLNPKIYIIILLGLLLSILFCCKPVVIQTVPTIEIEPLNNITSISAKYSGIVNSEGSATVLERGICWSITQNPTTSDNKIAHGAGLGSYTGSINDLQPNTPYYIRAYAINSVGISYSGQISFITSKVSLGDNYQGGKIFYIDESGSHGLIAAINDLVYSGDNTFYWGLNNVVGASDKNNGKANTLLMSKVMYSDCAGYAFKNGYELNGFKDWYIPAQNQLELMITNKKYVVGFSTQPNNSASYWSSTEVSLENAFADNFIILIGIYTPKHSGYKFRIRPIRDF